MNSKSKCGYVAIVGRPNVGKSTLLNKLIGQKISIVSAKPQTTRHQILGIKTENNAQIVFIDTPGLHHAEKRAMNRYMNRLASSVIMDADIVIFMVDATRWTEQDEVVLGKVSQTSHPVILVLNKLDKLKDKKHALPLIEKMKEKFSFAHIIPLSAKNGENCASLEKVLLEMLPEGPHLFPDEQVTDKNERFQIGEIIREKLIRATEQELPYSTTVIIESMKEQGKLLDIHAVIWVERDGQKAIVIGKQGELLKKIGTAARKEIVKLVKRKVFLRLWVKVKSDWTDDQNALGSLGYQGE